MTAPTFPLFKKQDNRLGKPFPAPHPSHDALKHLRGAKKPVFGHGINSQENGDNVIVFFSRLRKPG